MPRYAATHVPQAPDRALFQQRADLDVSRYLSDPPDPKIINGHIVERSPDDQELIESFANAFLQPKEREMIASILARQSNQLRFDAAEAEIIHNRHDPAFLSGLSNKANAGFPVSQFYDYILTIDNALAYLRGLHVEVMNLRQIAHPELMDQLKSTIIHEDGVPWEIADTAVYKQLNETDDVQRREKQAYQLGSEFMMQAGPNNAWTPRTRTTYEKCVDEAYIYDSPMYRLLIGLQQGLFLVKHTVADKLVPGDMAQPQQGGRNIITIGNWINTWDLPANTQVFPYVGSAKDAVTKSALAAQGAVNLWAMIAPQAAHFMPNAGAAPVAGPVVMGVWRPQYYLFPKVYGVKNYPLNWCGYVYTSNKLGASASDALLAFGYPHTTDLFTKGHPVPQGGGPIAYWNFNLSSNQAGAGFVSVWLKLVDPEGGNFSLMPHVTAANHQGPQNGHAYRADDGWFYTSDSLRAAPAVHGQVQAPTPDNYIGKTSHFHAIETDWDAVFAAMMNMSYHPVWACPRLSKAYAASGVGSVLQNMYRMLQRHFLAQYKNVDQLALVQPDARRILMSSGRSLMNRVPGSCPGGTQPRYMTYNGDVLDYKEATYRDNDGNWWMRSNVDPTRCSCEPKVRALAFTVEDGDRPNTRTRASSTTTIRMPYGTPYDITPDEAQKQIEAGRRVFKESNSQGTSTGLLYGALLARKGHMESEEDPNEVAEEEFSSLSETEPEEEDGRAPPVERKKHRVAPSRDTAVDSKEEAKHMRVSRKNNPEYKLVHRVNKNGVRQRFYVRKSPTVSG